MIRKTTRRKHFEATATAPANIAFIKYWGKKNPKLNIPLNDSISMNLSECVTKTTVVFDPVLNKDELCINGVEATEKQRRRVSSFLDWVRDLAKFECWAQVESKNSFPIGQGIAASAAGFAALALAAVKAVGLSLSIKELSILARKGSGSACRSVIDGFAYWKKGVNDATSYAMSLAPVRHWKIIDLVVVMKDGKVVDSTYGHESALTSKLLKQRLVNVRRRLKKIKVALKGKDFSLFGRLVEQECMEFNAIQITSNPWFLSWNNGSVATIKNIREWRNRGDQLYFTNDAGPHLHVLCLEKDAVGLARRLRSLAQVRQVLINKPSRGARIIK